MNIILFTSAANTSGGSRQALYLAQGLVEQGHTVLFFVPGHSKLPELAPAAGFWRSFPAQGSWKREIETAMAAMAANGNPVVVHAFHNAAVKRAAWWGLFWRKRAVVVAHRGVIFRPHNPLPYWSPGMDAFLVNSKACGKILRGIGLSPRRLFYVPNCVPDARLAAATDPASLRASLGIPAGAPLFLSIGGNKPYKGVRELILAFASAFPASSGDSSHCVEANELRRELRPHPPGPCRPWPRRTGSDSAPTIDPNESHRSPGSAVATEKPHLVILGLSHELWLPLVNDTGIADRIHCLGKTENVGSYLSAASVFVLPSLSESMPNTLLEAVRAGLPCIGTNVGAVPDILSGTDNACGLVVPPGDVPALAAAMRRMADEPELRASFARAAALAGEAYRPEKRIALAQSIYEELLRRKGLM